MAPGIALAGDLERESAEQKEERRQSSKDSEIERKGDTTRTERGTEN